MVLRLQEGVEVMAVLDVSSSMLAEDIKPNRLTRAKLTIEEMMDRMGGNDVGLVLFSGAAFVQFPLTADFGTARKFLRGAGPDSISRPGTAMAEAIRVAVEGFSEQRATSRVILFLTDGEGHEGDPLAEARKAAGRGIVIHTIGYGSPDGEPIPLRDASGALIGYKKNAAGDTVLSRLDEPTLRQIADETGGLYARSSAGGEEVDAVVDAVLALETDQREGRIETTGVERFTWFTVAALLFLSVEALIGDRKGTPKDGLES
jgi:Ca-activated chloride channel family protein